MSRIVRAGRALLLGAVAGLAAVAVAGGCGSSQPASEELFHHGSLGEVGGLYQTYLVDAKKPPTKLDDLLKYELGMPIGYKELKEGNVVVLWGANLGDTDVDKVLAYEKATPESGGYVLMADGKTIKKMSADEFKAAPKAAGTAVKS